jgi:hypothetical protein
MDYCCGVWGFKSDRQCEKVHLRTLRAFLGVGKYSAIPALEGDMGLLPLNIYDIM